VSNKKDHQTRTNILGLTVPLFAQSGFDGVSMRDVAEEIGLTPAALYYHFKDKEQLYLETVKYAFQKKTTAAKAVVDMGSDPLKRLEAFITWFTKTLGKEKDFQKLMQWVLLDTDKARMQNLIKETFRDLFVSIQGLGESFKPKYDPHMLSISIIGLVVYHFETTEARKTLPGNKSSHDQPKTIARHVISLLRNGLMPAQPTLHTN